MELGRPLSTITPTLDGDVLAMLARHDTSFTTGQLHRILTQYSEEGIRKVLQRLTKQGIVESERIGNAFSYQLNREHLAAEHVIGLAHLTETLLNRLEALLAAWEIRPKYAAVFGSAARGSMTVDSDLDVLLVRPDRADVDVWDAQVHDMTSDVTRWIGNDVRVLQFAAKEIVGRGAEEPVLRDVVADGLTLAGTRAWLTKHLRKSRS